MIDYFFGGFGAYFSGKSYQLAQQQLKSKVISSLRNAIRLTNKHIQDNRNGEFGEVNFSDVDSKELVNAWSLAAEAIRPISSDWAKVFEQKSDYWTSPVGFRQDIQNQTRRFDFRFRLSEVEKKLIELENNF
jgi:hypothetical protein